MFFIYYRLFVTIDYCCETLNERWQATVIKFIKWLTKTKLITTIVDVATRIDIITASSSIAYFGVLSIFPAIIVVGTLLPYCGLTIGTALSYAQASVPISVYDFLRPIITSILSQNGFGVLSASIIFTLWSLSRVVASIRIAQNGIFGVTAKNMAIIDRLISMAWLMVVLGIMGLLLLIASIGSNILVTLPINPHLIHQIESAKQPVVAIGLFIGISLFNWILPAKKPRLQWALIGTILQVAMVFGLTQAFGWYVSLATRQAYSFYQALGSAIFVLLWLNFTALASLIGTIVTAILEELFPSKNDRLATIQTLSRVIIPSKKLK